MTKRYTASLVKTHRTIVTLCLTLLTALQLPAAPKARYQVPIENGEIRVKNLVQELLRAADSSIELPNGFPDQAIPLPAGLARLTLTAWNLAFSKTGLQLEVNDDVLAIQVDEKKLQANIDECETLICQFFGLERKEAELIHLSDADARGPVVVMLHGVDSSRRQFLGACDWLDQRGYDVYFFEYPNDDRIRRNAERLSNKLRELPKHRRQDISLVTLSMGGLVAQCMLEDDALHVPGVRRLIACTPPFKGSRLAKIRVLNELDDMFESLMHGGGFEAPFRDGLGLGGHDLRPGSVLLQELAEGKRREGVQYSILAGNRSFLSAGLINKASGLVAKNALASPLEETGRALIREQLDDLMRFTDGKGDGAVTLESATLDGVEDRQVLPLTHLQFLVGDEPRADIPALAEVLQRLPKIDAAAKKFGTETLKAMPHQNKREQPEEKKEKKRGFFSL